MVTPEQVRHVSRGESEMVEQEDLIRQIAQWRGGPTLQKGFIDERGPPPPPADPQVAKEEMMTVKGRPRLAIRTATRLWKTRPMHLMFQHGRR